MIFARLTQRWQALRFWREPQSRSRLDLVRQLDQAPGSVPATALRQLSQREYLVRGLDPRERLRCVLAHYRFEDASFDSGYLQAIYGAGSGIDLWRHDSSDGAFALTLSTGPQIGAEGDLTISLNVDGVVLHRLSFSWVEGALFGIDLPSAPLVTRNEGRWSESGAAFAAFERGFPNNSPSFFCFAALQGMAGLLGIERVLAVRAPAHVAYVAHADEEAARAVENSYDGFWRILGGVELDARCYSIALPFYLKPLQDMPSKHRKRAAQRREYWRLIGEATRATLAPLQLPAQRRAGVRSDARSTAQA